MLFHIPHNIFQLITMRADYHMDMAAHDAPSINIKSFMLLAVPKAIKHNVFILVAGKQVYPVYNSKAYKVEFVLVVEFVFCAHLG